MKKILALGTAIAMTTLVFTPTAAAWHSDQACDDQPIVDVEMEDPIIDPDVPEITGCTVRDAVHKAGPCDGGQIGATHEDLGRVCVTPPEQCSGEDVGAVHPLVGEQCYEPPEECSRDDEIGVDGGTAGDHCYTEQELCEEVDKRVHMTDPPWGDCEE